MKRYVVTDLHVDHLKLKEFCYRPEGYAEMIHQAWCEIIKPEDQVFVLGDLFFGKRKRFVDYMAGLPGRRILIRGNHDHESDTFYLDKCGFSAVAYSMTILKNVILSHKPVMVGPDQYNIHGHLHDISPEYWLSKGGEDYSFLCERHFNVCPEIVGYEPLEIQKLLQLQQPQ